MAYQALYRKWRPQTFEQVLGQTATVKTLRRQIEDGRIAHAYLFCGCRGTGKTTMAKLMSRAINCLNPSHGDPCGQCETCRAIISETTMDVLELDAASNNSVDNIRELLELRQKFPDAKIIIAHYGRSYNIEVIRRAYAEMGKDMEGFYFDNAAVINPEVHRFMLEHLPQDRIFYGSDMPLLLWHGKRTWESGTYHNHAKEHFPWNAGAPESEAERSGYTFFLYEQARHLLDAIDSVGGPALAQKVFCDNARAFVASVLGG